MKQVVFGRTGVKVSEMCLGTMMFGKRTDEEASDRIVAAALEGGVNFLDTAAMYSDGGCEEVLGRVLRDRRDRVFLATKVHKGVDYESIVGSLDESLTRLGTDHVDLYMIHWPKAGMRPEEIMRALNDVVSAGKTRFVGCSNYPAWLYANSNRVARANGWVELMCNQVPYNPLERGIEVEILPQAVAEKVAITTYRPLSMGLLAGKYDPDKPLPSGTRSTTDDRLSRWLERYAGGVRYVLRLAEERGVTPAQVAIAWVRTSPAVTCPIVGVSRLAQLDDCLRAFAFELSAEERQGISDAFGAEVREEAGGDFPALRRELHLTGA